MTRFLTALLLVAPLHLFAGGVSAPPVFWNVFEAISVSKKTVTLKWEVTEYNNKRFYIQHSLDGNAWQDIDSVESKKSPFSLEDYYYKHTNKQGGRHYYRMMQRDIDESNTGYSKVIVVTLEGEEEQPALSAISFHPNPCSAQLRIVSNEGNDYTYTSARIYNLSGFLVAEKKIEAHSNVMQLGDLPAGVYIARIGCSNGKVFSQKLMKQ